MAFFFSCSKARLTTASPPSPPFSFLLSSMSTCYGHQYDLSCQSCCACSAHLEVRNLALLNPDCTRMVSSLTNAHTHTQCCLCSTRPPHEANSGTTLCTRRSTWVYRSWCSVMLQSSMPGRSVSKKKTLWTHSFHGSMNALSRDVCARYIVWTWFVICGWSWICLYTSSHHNFCRKHFLYFWVIFIQCSDVLKSQKTMGCFSSKAGGESNAWVELDY